MTKWKIPTRNVDLGGWFQIVMTKPGHAAVDVTFFRDVATQLDSFSNADPFGDSAAVISFPQITPFDDPDGGDLQNWFGLFSNVDIWWVPGIEKDTYSNYDPDPASWINPITNLPDIFAPRPFKANPSHHAYDLRIKLWEGFVSSIEFSSDDQSQTLQLQCQGALFQLDRYLQKPSYPPRPIPLEKIMQFTFNHIDKPHLRTKQMAIQWPSGWSKLAPKRNKGTNPAYVLDARANTKWTGYASRQTGSWDRCLTGFVQDQLSVMLVQPGFGGPTGSSWTMGLRRQTQTLPGRTPILLVRDQNRDPDFALWLGTPGVTVTLTRDGTQMANIVYGDGTSIDGTVWRNAIISNDGSRTDYQPLAWSDAVYPYGSNKEFHRNAFAAEAYLKFGAGFEQSQATQSAERQLKRDLDPGYTGSIGLKVDPSQMSKWQIRAGMTVLLRGLAGTGSSGVRFHISEVQANPNDNSVSLTIDTRYRDLLTVEEARARTRDPLTPTRMLQINRTSVIIEDKAAPWDYRTGSGYIPKDSRKFFTSKPANEKFPYTASLKKYPPWRHPHFYTTVKANADARKNRWTRVPILTAEKGTIRRIEVICVDSKGNVLKVPFHLSLYYVNVTPQAMPRDKYGPSPYINNAFTTVNPATGLPWGPGNYFQPDPSYIIGWGGRVGGVYERAGFWPGRETLGSPASGLFVDEAGFPFDNTQGTNQEWNPDATKGVKQTAKAITIYGMFYAEYTEPVYFLARMFRQSPGAN